jgi:hypothetical protein
MITAMQELIDELKLIEAYPMSPLILRMATDLLEKEKEQIEQAFRKGGHFQAFGGSNVDTYYTETYKNQTP